METSYGHHVPNIRYRHLLHVQQRIYKLVACESVEIG